MRARRLFILGSTGSIGVSTLQVVAHLNALGSHRFEVVGLATGSRVDDVTRQAKQFGVQHVAIAHADGDHCSGSWAGRLYRGPDAAMEMITHAAEPGDMVVGAMVGSAGIPAILAAIDRGCDIALANKETLVAAGALVMPRVRARGVNLLPVDSEHSAIFQALEGLEAWRHEGLMNGPVDVQAFKPSNLQASLSRITLTASGGPFRTWSAERMAGATIAQALNHPTWSMGPKVTIDSATLMNKALEVIEAHWLFDTPADRIDVVIHPQSIVHGMVEFADGSVIAHLSPPDMRTPIQYALTWPQRAAGLSRRIDWSTMRTLEFEPVDETRFIAPSLARRVIEAGVSGASAGAILNAANEVAVQAFLDGRIAFSRIVELVQNACETIEPGPVRTMDDVTAADSAARAHVRSLLALEHAPEAGVSP